jgi:hypothetical protein
LRGAIGSKLHRSAFAGDRFAQIPLIHSRLRERVISDPLLPFPVGLGTGGERQ